jgi:phage N-6-adenine-methyltransferase
MADLATRFSSQRQDWTTPRSLFDQLDREFSFEWDLAASSDNALCPSFFSQAENGLKQTWKGVCWLNPPYGDPASKLVNWIRKAWFDTQADSTLTVVMLIPARTNTNWFHDYCMKAAEVRFICGRPKFGNSPHGLPLPLMLVVFRKSPETRVLSFKLSRA